MHTSEALIRIRDLVREIQHLSQPAERKAFANEMAAIGARTKAEAVLEADDDTVADNADELNATIDAASAASDAREGVRRLNELLTSTLVQVEDQLLDIAHSQTYNVDLKQ